MLLLIRCSKEIALSTSRRQLPEVIEICAPVVATGKMFLIKTQESVYHMSGVYQESHFKSSQAAIKSFKLVDRMFHYSIMSTASRQLWLNIDHNRIPEILKLRKGITIIPDPAHSMIVFDMQHNNIELKHLSEVRRLGVWPVMDLKANVPVYAMETKAGSSHIANRVNFASQFYVVDVIREEDAPNLRHKGEVSSLQHNSYKNDKVEFSFALEDQCYILKDLGSPKNTSNRVSKSMIKNALLKSTNGTSKNPTPKVRQTGFLHKLRLKEKIMG